jgi:hypothetical protein
MNDNELVVEAGVHYRFQKNDKEVCPIGMREYRYERFKEGYSFGTDRIFILSSRTLDFYILLDTWNRKGAGKYTYVSVTNA